MATKLPPKPPKPVALPSPLPFLESPNQSSRHGVKPIHICVHRPVGGYEGVIRTLRDPDNHGNPVSAHIATEGRGTGLDVATQLVPWDRKAWAASAFNALGYQLEVDDDAWDGDDLGAAFTAARIVAFISWKTGIPCEWPKQGKNPTHLPGIYRHFDYGAAGGNHTDPTTDPVYWKWFIRQCVRERDRGDFRKTWGKGRFVKIKGV